MKASDVTAIAEPVLARRGLELDEVQVIPAGKRAIVRITVDGDGPRGRGPLLDDIAEASQEIGAALDDADLGGQAYTLEVSSRGLGKPLAKPAHWRRNRGRLVSVRVGEEQLTGRIMGSDEATATLDVDGTERVIELAEARKPLIQVEMNRPADPELDDVAIEGDDTDDETDDDADLGDDEADEADAAEEEDER